LLLILLGAPVAAIIMASKLASSVGVPLCIGAILVVVLGALDLLGSFDDDDSSVAFTSRVSELGQPVVVLALSVAGLLALLRMAVAGRLPVVGSAIAIPVAFLSTVLAVYAVGYRLGPWRNDESGKPRPLHRRHGFWLVVITTLLYLPMLGNHSLIDPWETHYGEVAREILARNDWISLWWAQEKWFWSKPVLAFWLQAGAMALLGVNYAPGEMLSSVSKGLEPQPEWAVRMPIFLLTVLAVYLLYKGVARSHGRRAGLLGGVVLLTMPQFFFVAHQTMTDMPFVAATAACIGLFLLAVRSDPEQLVRSYELRLGSFRLRWSLFHVVIGAVLLVVVPQTLYLLSRNLMLSFGEHFDARFVRDSFAQGSPGNCGLPGNQACAAGLLPAVKRLEPAIQALIWLQALALMLWMSWGERRRKRLLFLAAWLCAAIATMAKGPAGLVLPVAAAVAWVIATKRWRELSRMEITAGTLLVASCILPWVVAMYVRHGSPFTDRLLFHHMFKRAFAHVHDTNAGVDVSFRYYVWQLGYATFPWVGLAPIAVVRWMRKDNDPNAQGSAITIAAWFLFAFALFSLVGTKFHHYIMPALPPLAVMCGLLLDDMMRSASKCGSRRFDQQTADRVLLGAVAIGAALLTYMVGRDLAMGFPKRDSQIRLMHLFTYNYTRPWPKSLDFSPVLGLFTWAAAIGTAALVVQRWRKQIVLALVGLACLWTAWSLDVYFEKTSPHWGQRELLLTYEKARLERPGVLIAYQMNWKGENFYRGNRLPVFVSSGAKFQAWVDAQKRKGHKLMYFVTEHKRMRALHNELGKPRDFDKLTDAKLNNKFQLVRVQFP